MLTLISGVGEDEGEQSALWGVNLFELPTGLRIKGPPLLKAVYNASRSPRLWTFFDKALANEMSPQPRSVLLVLGLQYCYASWNKSSQEKYGTSLMSYNESLNT